jgi:hypothetical protein
VIYVAAPGNTGDRLLQSLGLDVPLIRDVLLYGHAEAATYTEFDAPGAGEYARWSRHVRRLSEILVPASWQRINFDNQPTLIHPSNKWCLIVASGSSGTGVLYTVPTTKNPKGRTIRDAVSDNVELATVSLFAPQELDPKLAGLRKTWMLLTHLNIHDQIQSEVSLPCEMGGEYITAWQERIILPTIDPSDGSYGTGGEEEPPSYDFDIVRK